MCKKRILMICNESNTVINFRKELILFLREKKYDVTVIVADNNRVDDIAKLNVSVVTVPYNNRSKNPFSFISLKRKFCRVIMNIKPDIVFTFQAKPNMIGALAARKSGIAEVYSMIEGLGDPFQPKTFKERIIKIIVSFLYRKSLKASKRVFFLNEDDCNEFVVNNIVSKDKCLVIPGIGIDLKNYLFEQNIANNKRVLILSRLLKNKGILDCCEIAKLVKRRRPDIDFYIFGDEANIKASDLSEYINAGTIIYKGFTKDVKKEILDSRVVLSCSFREGFPRIFLESMAIGRVVVASDVIGNRSAIVNGVTGFLLPSHNISAFADTIISIIDDEELLKKIAYQARKVCEEKYCSDIVNMTILKEIQAN